MDLMTASLPQPDLWTVTHNMLKIGDATFTAHYPYIMLERQWVFFVTTLQRMQFRFSFRIYGAHSRLGVFSLRKTKECCGHSFIIRVLQGMCTLSYRIQWTHTKNTMTICSSEMWQKGDLEIWEKSKLSKNTLMVLKPNPVL